MHRDLVIVYCLHAVDVATIEPYSPQTDDVCDELDSGSFPPPPLPPKGLKAL